MVENYNISGRHTCHIDMNSSYLIQKISTVINKYIAKDMEASQIFSISGWRPLLYACRFCLSST